MSDHGCLLDALLLFQKGFHFAWLDAVASYLDLVVDAPQKLQVPILTIADQVATAIHPRRRAPV